MSPFEPDASAGATSLDPNELEGLIPDYITTQSELNQLESNNILDAASWAFHKQPSDFLNVTFTLDLHRRMFNRVWKWAGKPRTSNKHIGVFKEKIVSALAILFGDAQYWLDHKTYPADEIAARFHHRLVAIHVFVNGNGRHARLMTEILLTHAGQEPFSWGMKTSERALDVQGVLRNEYVAALQEADRGDYDRLLRFVRS